MRFWIVFFLLLAAPLVGQQVDEISTPSAPEGRILDDARLFTLEPQVLQSLSTRLRSISERTGYEVYVAIFDSLIGSNVREQSRILQEAWIGDRPGVVLVLEADSSTHELGWSRLPDAVTETGESVPVLGESDLAPQDQVRIINELSGYRTTETSSTRSAENLIVVFADGIDAAFKKVDEAKPPRWNYRVLLLGAGLLAAMLLAGLLVGAWIRRADRKVADRLVFPDVSVGMRLGAPCGGGKLSSRSFDVLPRGRA